jgi:hypothetical protein
MTERFFSEEQISKLEKDYSKLNDSYQSLLTQYAFRKFKNDQSNEFAKHGFMRRIKTLLRCIHNIYRICPPSNEDKLSADDLYDVSINLQSFIFNLYGACDNLAWIWVKEKDIRNKKKQFSSK